MHTRDAHSAKWKFRMLARLLRCNRQKKSGVAYGGHVSLSGSRWFPAAQVTSFMQAPVAVRSRDFPVMMEMGSQQAAPLHFSVLLDKPDPLTSVATASTGLARGLIRVQLCLMWEGEVMASSQEVTLIPPQSMGRILAIRALSHWSYAMRPM